MKIDVMKSLFLAIASAVAASGAVILTAKDNLAGYTFVDLEWSGSFVEGADNVTLFGTIESVQNQVMSMYPNATNTTQNQAARRNGKSVVPRNAGQITCNIAWIGGTAQEPVLEQGIAYLDKMAGIQCHLGPGPNICTRVSCSWDSGIFFCNDDTYDVYVDCSTFGDYTQNIIDQCAYASGSTLGQQNDTAGWHVVAGGGNAGKGGC